MKTTILLSKVCSLFLVQKKISVFPKQPVYLWLFFKFKNGSSVTPKQETALYYATSSVTQGSDFPRSGL